MLNMKPFPTRSYRWTLQVKQSHADGFYMVGAFKTRREADVYEREHHRRDITIIGKASFPS